MAPEASTSLDVRSSNALHGDFDPFHASTKDCVLGYELCVSVNVSFYMCVCVCARVCVCLDR